MEKRKSIFVTFIIALLLISMTAFAYGAELEADTYRDGKIEISFPETSDIEEIAIDESRDAVFEHILAADMNDGEGSIHFDMYYSSDESEEFIYFHEDKDGAFNYYDEYGEEVLKDIIGEISEDELLSLGEPEYYQSEWVTYLKVKAVFEKENGGDRYDSLIYITADSVEDMLINKVMIFSGHNGAVTAEEMESEVQPVIDSFYDYGYDEKMAGVSEDDDYYGDSSDTGFVFGEYFEIFIGLIVLICVVLFKRGFGSRISEKLSNRRAGKNPAGKHLYKEGKKGPAAEALYKKSRKNPAENPLHKIRRREKKTQVEHEFRKRSESKAHSSIHKFTRSPDAEDRYIESLKTLLKSGLLTREEMNEMIEKHNRMK